MFTLASSRKSPAEIVLTVSGECMRILSCYEKNKTIYINIYYVHQLADSVGLLRANQ